MKKDRRILVTGGCGYVGTVLVPKLLRRYPVTVLDSLLFGNHLKPAANLSVVEGDIRDARLMRSLLSKATDVIHLASIANDPCSDLDPALTYQVNRDAVAQLVNTAKEVGVSRFISASSSSVYGVKEEESVTEDLSLEPLTLYAKTKAESEKIVAAAAGNGFTTVSIRSATVCGPSPRMRFDVIVNIMAKSAIVDGTITVFGGGQHRPNIHIDDITDLYVMLLEVPADKINGKVFNAGATNHTVKEIAEMAQAETGATIKIDSNVTDNRSYRISSEKIKRELGFEPEKPIRQAIKDIKEAFANGVFPNPNSSIYYNIKTMKEKMAGRAV
ncbi:MAG: SDR family oxidoreductase [Chloroflexota bacterium]|nr:SDR family oxidoreductase [Chloroflexota bacterium]